MDVQVKYFNNEISFLLFFCSKFIGQLFFLSIYFILNQKKLFQYGNLNFQITRGIFTAIPTILFFYALKFIPLAEAVAITFLHPIFVVIFSAYLLKEKISIINVIVILIGFLGVLIITRPGMGIMHPASFLILFACLFFAFYQILSKHLMQVSNPVSILFFTTITGVVISIFVLPFIEISNLSKTYFFILIFFGAFSSLGEFFLILAYKNESATFLAPLFYCMLIWATLNGYIFFREFPDFFSILGTILLIFAGIFNFYYKK